MISRQAVVDQARTWLGTPFVHQAAVKGEGTDCIGLVAGVGAALGMPEAVRWAADARRLAYTREPEPGMLIEAVDDYLIEIDPASATLGDVVLLRIKGSPQHFGILTTDDPRYMIHAYTTAAKVVENVYDGIWARRCYRAYRYHGLA